MAVEVDDLDKLRDEIIRLCNEKIYSIESCVTYSKKFNRYDRFNEYIELYETVGKLR